MRIINWIGDIYKTHGYIAALVTIVVLVALALGVSLLAGVDLGALTGWLGAL